MKAERWKQIKEVFSTASELEPQERSRYLSEVCGEDSSLLMEVKALLESSEQASSFIEKPILGGVTTSRPDASADAEIGRSIGPYKIAAVIGEGGMGAVYRGVRSNGDFQQQVAIKLIKQGMDTQFMQRRFRTERQILARLDHPNIARFLDGGVAEDGRPYFIMEYLDGTPLPEYCDQHNLDVRGRLNLFLPICAAVQYAHQNLVIHRDIKASNILVTNEGVPKLLDFGIAKLLDRDRSTTTGGGDSTMPMLRMMTPDYASPEQVRGEPITTASDVYSLGVLLFELLSGRRPYKFSGVPVHEILRTLTEVDPQKPSDVAEAPGRAKQLTGDLDTIVLKAIHKEAGLRYASPQQLAEDLRRHLDGRPVIARGDTVRYRAAKFIRRHKAGVVAAVLIVIAIIAGAASTTWQAGVAAAQQEHARKRFYETRELANSLLFELDQSLSMLPGSTYARQILIKKVLYYLDSLSTEAYTDPYLKQEIAAAYERLGDIQGNAKGPNLGDSAGALVSYRKSLAILDSLAGQHSEDARILRDLATCHVKISDVLALTGDHTGALENDRKALSLRETLVSVDPRNSEAKAELAATYQKIAADLGSFGDWKGSLANRRKAVDMLGALFRDNPNQPATRRTYALASKRLGRMVGKDGDTAAALVLFQTALDIDNADLQQDPVNMNLRMNISYTYSDIADTLVEVKRYDEALESYRKALQIRTQLAAADPRDVRTASALSTTQLRIGDILVKKGKTEEGLTNLRKALENRERLSAIDPNNAGARGEVGESYASLGDAFATLKRRDEARKWYGKALEVYEELQGKGRLSAFYIAEIDRIKQQVKR